MTKTELWELQGILQELERSRQKNMGDGTDLSREDAWRAQSHGEVIAYDHAIDLLTHFLKGKQP